MSITVRNLKTLSAKEKAEGIYIGRPSLLGNPFPMRVESDRQKVVESYKKWLWSQLQTETELKLEIEKLAVQYVQGKDLKLDCFCSPKACHGDVLKSCIEWCADNNLKYYAGIGSRQTPKDICCQMTEVAKQLDSENWILSSGGAKGADSAFEAGTSQAVISYRADYYLTKFGKFKYDAEILKEAEKIASTLHPAWDKCNDYARKMHTRNVFQILGHDLNTPVQKVICWTPEGKVVGGTATAIRLAERNQIEVINYANH